MSTGEREGVSVERYAFDFVFGFAVLDCHQASHADAGCAVVELPAHRVGWSWIDVQLFVPLLWLEDQGATEVGSATTSLVEVCEDAKWDGMLLHDSG